MWDPAYMIWRLFKWLELISFFMLVTMKIILAQIYYPTPTPTHTHTHSRVLSHVTPRICPSRHHTESSRCHTYGGMTMLMEFTRGWPKLCYKKLGGGGGAAAASFLPTDVEWKQGIGHVSRSLCLSHFNKN